MPKFEVGVTGALIQGDVLDVNTKTLELALKAYDPQLYLKWNPHKRQGMGVWELRRRPAQKTIKETIKYGGNTYCIVDYKENNFEHHVWDLGHLGYDLLQRLKDGDTFTMANYEGKEHRMTDFLNKMEDARYAKQDREVAQLRQERMYNIMQDKGLLKDFQEKILSGVNPAHLMRFWK